MARKWAHNRTSIENIPLPLFVEGIQLMKLGGKSRIVIPRSKEQKGDKLTIWEIELLEIN